MRNKKRKILITCILFTVLAILWITKPAFATYDVSLFDGSGNSRADKLAETIMGTGIGTLRMVGTGISILMLSYIGIKYMLASPNEKADFKKSAMIFGLGAILVFVGTNIIGFIIQFGQGAGLISK